MSKHRPRSPVHCQVSDHAVLRYLERVKGINIDAVKAEILTDDRKNLIAAGCKAIKSDGYILVVSNYTVITVLNTKDQPY